MFEKLFSEEDSDVGPELAELFQDAGTTYLQIAERISDRCRPARLSKIEHFPESDVVFARGIIESEFVADPRIIGSEDFAKPIEYESDRTSIQTLGQRNQKKWNRNP